MKHIEVVAAIILFDNKVLCVQRDLNKYHYISNKFEFPGGKIERDESKIDALKREIDEELKMKIDVQTEFLTVVHEYPDFILTMHSFLCSCQNTNLILTEHIDFKWLPKEELSKLDWAAADIPIMEKLMNTSLLSKWN